MTYKLLYTPRVRKELEKIDPHVRGNIKKALEKISSNPEVGKPLEYEFKDLRSYRAGSYRVIYKIYRKEVHVIVVAVGYRREIYDKLKNILK